MRSEMPYKQITQLPDSVKNNLPKHAQEIYKEAFNSAEDQYGEEEKEETERKKREGSEQGQQHVSNTEEAKQARETANPKATRRGAGS